MAALSDKRCFVDKVSIHLDYCLNFIHEHVQYKYKTKFFIDTKIRPVYIESPVCVVKGAVMCSFEY